MKLRDKYFNKETGEIYVIVLIYVNRKVFGLATESSPSKVMEVTINNLNKHWEKYENNS